MPGTKLTSPCGGTATGTAADYIPARPSLATMRAAVQTCRGCGLWSCGRAVFGEGPRKPTVMFVGEQPGDREEAEGHPFVGPSGVLFDAALEAGGIDRGDAYVTNAVKHFKYERAAHGERRLHKKPSDGEMRACRPWLIAEITLLRPRVIVALGATAARSLLGNQFRVTQQRGEPVASELAEIVLATVHPSSVLRAPSEMRAQEREMFFADIARVASLLAR